MMGERIREQGPFSPWGEGARRAGGSPSARRADEGAFIATNEVPPHQLGQMTCDRVGNVGGGLAVGVSGRKSWPRVLSPKGRGGCGCGPILMDHPSATTILRGQTLAFRDDPFKVEPDAAVDFHADGAVAIAEGKILEVGAASDVIAHHPGADGRELRRAPHHGRLRRLPRALPADRHHRLLRRAAAGLAREIHLPRRGSVRRPGPRRCGRPPVSGRMPAQRHHHLLGLLHRASGFRRRLLHGRAAARVLHGGRQGDDGPQCAERSARQRPDRLRAVQGADRALARGRQAHLRRHAALCRHIVAGPAGGRGRARGASIQQR